MSTVSTRLVDCYNTLNTCPAEPARSAFPDHQRIDLATSPARGGNWASWWITSSLPGSRLSADEGNELDWPRTSANKNRILL